MAIQWEDGLLKGYLLGLIKMGDVIMSKKYLYTITFLQLIVSVVGIILIIMNIIGIRKTDNLFLFIFLTVLAISQCVDNITKIKDKSYHWVLAIYILNVKHKSVQRGWNLSAFLGNGNDRKAKHNTHWKQTR